MGCANGQGSAPTPGCCGLDPRHAPARGQPRGGTQLSVAPGGCSEGLAQGGASCLQLLGGCSAWALLPLRPALRSHFQTAWRCWSPALQQMKGCREEMPTPGSAWVMCGAMGLPPLALLGLHVGGQGPGVPAANPHRPSRASSQQCVFESWLCRAAELRLQCRFGPIMLTVLVRVVSPPDLAALCKLLPTTGVRNHGL